MAAPAAIKAVPVKYVPEAPCRNPFRNQRHDEIHVHVVLDSENEHRHAEQDTAERSEKALHRHARHGASADVRPSRATFAIGDVATGTQ